MESDISAAQDIGADELYERKQFIADPGQQPMRLDKWIHMRLENVSRNKVQQGLENGFVTVNGLPAKSNYKIRPGDIVVLMSLTNPESTEVKPEEIPLEIIYEDDALMVINKAADMVVHPGVGNYTGTLLNGIAWHLLKNNPDLNEESLPRFGLVHRIDKNTTGLLVVAKTAESASHLARQFANHTVQRKYTALVWGDISDDAGTIDMHIARHYRHRKIYDTYPDGDIGKHAITHYNVVERFNYVTLVECKLETGRTHQIRVHLKHIGHTLFNDWEYGGDRILKGTVFTKYKQFVDNCFQVCPRCALHAGLLGFIHPVTEKEMIFQQPLPTDMHLVIDKWRSYTKVRPLEN